ncbi:hypothetical protein [Catenuloplanes atrovinosus]|uniref:Uncharacterized protein n=1 Tax=Catenuloplanes atrovinosus TaxID=137266 RepID=A0AAE4CA80_9ACTN|nr:hypothetical protein [Catenuloplanes atrovinosus]MDR7276778.1 hypothetical protein [Catenuloplanes atrovinosus]
MRGKTTSAGIAAGVLAATMGATVAQAGPLPTPTATITTPAGPLTRQSLHGDPVAIAFAGKGVDGKKAVPGTRFRWTAHGRGGVRKVLCSGSAVPHGGPIKDKIAIYRDCASFTAWLGMLPGDITSTTWTVRLEVFGGSGPAGVDTVPVKLVYVAL